MDPGPDGGGGPDHVMGCHVTVLRDCGWRSAFSKHRVSGYLFALFTKSGASHIPEATETISKFLVSYISRWLMGMF